MKIKLLANSLVFISFFFSIYSSYGAPTSGNPTSGNPTSVKSKTEKSSSGASTNKTATSGRLVKPVRRSIASLERSFVEALRGEWTQSEESEVFLDFFTKRRWGDALLHWNKSFGETSFSTSATGKALYAYLLFKHNIKIMGLDMLFGIDTPMEIPEELQSLWYKIAPYKNKVWNFVDVNWNDSWREIFDPEAEIITLLHNAFSLEEIESINRQYKLKDLRVLSQLEWNLILALASQNFLIEALKRLQGLMKLKKPPVSRSLMHLTAGRILFQLRSFDHAQSYYKLVPKSSDYWLTAQEEIAWTHIQNDEPQKALGYTHTLMHPVLANQVAPEPSYLHALASIKVCDYEEVFKTIDAFRVNFEPRIKSLLFVKKVGRTKSAVHLMQKFALNKKMPLSIFSLGAPARHLPYLVNHDKFLFDLSRKRRMLILESRRIRKLSSIISSKLQKEMQEDSTVSSDSYSLDTLQRLREIIDVKLEKYNKEFDRRIKDLASRDLEDIHQTIKKLHVTKSEAFHFITEKFFSKEVQEAYNKGEKLPQSTLKVDRNLYREVPYQRVFADKAKELWFDELGNYRVHTNGCENLAVNEIDKTSEASKVANEVNKADKTNEKADNKTNDKAGDNKK